MLARFPEQENCWPRRRLKCRAIHVVIVPLSVHVTGMTVAAVEAPAEGEVMVGNTGGSVVAATPVPAEFSAATANEYEAPAVHFHSRFRCLYRSREHPTFP